MLRFFNNCNIIQLSHIAASFEYIDKINQFSLYFIGDNMDALVKTDNYGAINTIDTNTMINFVI